MIDVHGIGERLRSEREKIGLSQGDLAEVGGVARTTEFRYETEAHSPSLEFLQSIEAVGIDSLFIISGTTLEQRTEALADAMQLIEDLLEKHDLKVPTKVRARLVSRVLEARSRSLKQHEAFKLDLGSLLELIACREKS